jgi:hypothetical protein
VQYEPDGVIGRLELSTLYGNSCITRRITPKSETMFNRRVEIFGAIKTQTRVNGEPKKVWRGLSLKSKQQNEEKDTENSQINRKNRELRIQRRKGVPKATTFSNYYLKDEALIAFASMLQREESELAKEEALLQFTILSNG